MGANMVRRLQAGGHRCVVYAVNPAAVPDLATEAGATGVHSLDELVDALEPPRQVWIMVPAAFVGSTVDRLADLLSPGDTVIDGGNSWYRDDVDRAAPLAERGLHHLDVGTSGGVFGLERGYCLMVGGEVAAVRPLEPVFAPLAPRFVSVTYGAGRGGAPVGAGGRLPPRGGGGGRGCRPGWPRGPPPPLAHRAVPASRRPRSAAGCTADRAAPGTS